MPTTPIISPDGTVADVPNEGVPALLAKGGQIGVDMLAPTGERAVVPIEHVQGLVQKGARLTGAPPAPPVPQGQLPGGIQQYRNIDDTKILPAVGPGAAPMTARQAAMVSDKIAGAPAGAAKGLVSTLDRIGGLIVPGTPSASDQELLKRAPNETAGYGAEQLAEFLAPGGLIGDAGKAAQAATAAKTGVRVLPYVAKALTEGGLNAGIEAAHGGDAKAIAYTGGAGAVGSAAQDAIGAATPWMQEHAANLYGKALSPTTKINKGITAKIVPDLLDQGEFGTLKGISGRAAAAKAEVGPQIDSLLQARGDVPQAIQPIMDSLDGYKQQFLSSNGTVLNKGAVDAVETLQGQLTDMAANGSTVPTKDLVAMRRILDDQVARAGGYAGTTLADGSTSDAMREGANSIRSELAKANPDLAVLNQKYSFWSNVQKVADATISRRTGQVGGILGNGAAELAGAVVGGGTGGALAAVGNVARQATTGPASRTFRAVQWNKLGSLIDSGQLSKAGRIARNLATAGVGYATTPDDNSPTNSPLSDAYYKGRDMSGIN